MFFPDYQQTKVVYHVVNINYLKKILQEGISIEERKNCSDEKYLDFNQFLDQHRPKTIPPWVKRERALFATLNFRENIKWHSHSALLALKVKEERCWIANENLANRIYDPFVLQHIEDFHHAKVYMDRHGSQRAAKYWENSLAFKQNLKVRRDLQENYDAEVMIFHNIPPKDIQCLMIVTDHCTFTPARWQQHYRNLVSSTDIP